VPVLFSSEHDYVTNVETLSVILYIHTYIDKVLCVHCVSEKKYHCYFL